MHRENPSDLAWVKEVCRLKGLRQFVMHISHVRCYSPSDWQYMPSHIPVPHPTDDLDSGGVWAFEDLGAWKLTHDIRTVMLDMEWTGKYYGSRQEYVRMVFTR